MDITISEMTQKDLEVLSPILSSQFDEFWTPRILESEFNSSHSHLFVAKTGDTIAGFGGIKVVLEEAEIMNLVTAKEFRKQGVGSKLLKELISLSHSLSCAVIFLEVRESNLSAISLYEQYDFFTIGRRKNYYAGIDDAILMKKELKTTH